MSERREHSTTTEKVRELLYNMPSTPKLIAAQQMQFIGKVVRGYFDQPPMMMPTAWCNHKRKAGGPNKTKKDFVVKHLRLLLARIHEVNIDHFGSLKD